MFLINYSTFNMSFEGSREKKAGVSKPKQTSKDLDNLKQAFPEKDFTASVKVGAEADQELAESLRDMREKEEKRRQRYEEIKRRQKEENTNA